MRRVLTLALIAVALLGVGVPEAYAQAPAPAPQVRITGFIDTITSWTKNEQDSLFGRSGDTEWYARNRGRVDITGALGSAKFVWGIEMDAVWGTTAATGVDNNLSAGGTAAQHFGATGAFDLNTDQQGSVETKWLYVEFPLPLMPFPTVIRMGAQAFAAQYKLAAYANGDFAGINLVTTFSPNVKWNFTYVAIEENVTGGRRGLGFGRGDDFALITSLEVTPFKGLDIRPLYSLAYLYGSTSGAARVARGGIGGVPAFTRASPAGSVGTGHIEERHTIGVDMRWRSGPFSLDPTFFYQFGTRDTDNPFIAAASSQTNRVTEADISAWFFDVIGGWRTGPLLLEGRYMYTSGNRPQDQLSRDVNHYQVLDVDSGYWAAGWGEIYSLGIDYFTGCIRTICNGIGLDRYGRQQFALRGTYSVTPAFDIRGVVSPAWTARSVDTDGITTFAGGAGNIAAPITCATHTVNSAANPRGQGCRGDDTYMGTELNLGMTWRFAPGLAFDLVGAILFTGGALDTSEVRNGVLTRREADNVYAIASRVRYSF